MRIAARSANAAVDSAIAVRAAAAVVFAAQAADAAAAAVVFAAQAADAAAAAVDAMRAADAAYDGTHAKCANLVREKIDEFTVLKLWEEQVQQMRMQEARA